MNDIERLRKDFEKFRTRLGELEQTARARDEELIIEEEIEKYPERFEILRPGYGNMKWESCYNRGGNYYYNVINTDWNQMGLNDKVFYIELIDNSGKSYKEIIRRKENENKC